MILVYLSNGACIEVPGAAAAETRDELLVCLDPRGRVLASFSTYLVEAFTSDPEMVETLEEELCQDLVVLPPGADRR